MKKRSSNSRTVKIRKIITRIYRSRPFSEKESKVAEALIECGSYRQASKELRIPEPTIRSTTFRIRLKYDHALYVVNAIREIQTRYRRKHGPRSKKFFTG